MKKDEILSKACFEEIKGVKVLHLKGKPYEMGYQYGYLLADKIYLMVNRTLLATAALLLHRKARILIRQRNSYGWSKRQLNLL